MYVSGLAMLAFRKILRTYLMDAPVFHFLISFESVNAHSLIENYLRILLSKQSVLLVLSISNTVVKAPFTVLCRNYTICNMYSDTSSFLLFLWLTFLILMQVSFQIILLGILIQTTTGCRTDQQTSLK